MKTELLLIGVVGVALYALTRQKETVTIIRTQAETPQQEMPQEAIVDPLQERAMFIFQNANVPLNKWVSDRLNELSELREQLTRSKGKIEQYNRLIPLIEQKQFDVAAGRLAATQGTV